MTKMEEFVDLNRERFWEDVFPKGQPVVMRGLVRDWPIVQAAKRGGETLSKYLLRFDRGYPLNTAFAPPSAGGRLFYNTDMSGMNFRLEESKLASALDFLDKHANDDPAPVLAIQSVPVAQFLPGLVQENPMPFLSESIDPRIWIGGKVVVAAHFDPSENIACCVAGRRRFTLFAPGQVKNLYPGPFENTPSGAVVSMVDFDNPDFEKYPRFAEAQKQALVADLEPGDAIFIPYLWWHHVRSLDPVNILMNYWWGQLDSKMTDPNIAMYHAMLAVKSLSAGRKAAWKQMFDYYVFEEAGPSGEHLPAEKRGVLGELGEKALRNLKAALARSLTRA